MTFLSNSVDKLTKIVLFLVTLSIVLVPVIFIFGNEPINYEEWSSSFTKYSKWSNHIDKIGKADVMNIYLKNTEQTTNLKELKQVNELADYISYELAHAKQYIVVKKHLEIRSKKIKPSLLESLNVTWSSSIKDQAPLKQIKGMIEEYIDFEKPSLRQKIYVLICIGDIEAKFAEQINQIIQQNPQYKIVIVSLFPVSSKRIQIVKIDEEFSAEEPEQIKPKLKNTKNSKSKQKTDNDKAKSASKKTKEQKNRQSKKSDKNKKKQQTNDSKEQPGVPEQGQSALPNEEISEPIVEEIKNKNETANIQSTGQQTDIAANTQLQAGDQVENESLVEKNQEQL